MTDWDGFICRDLHHAWTYATARRVKDGFERSLFCATCTTEKIQTLDASGYVINTKFKYPDGYLRPKGAGRVTKEENAGIRLANLKKAVRRRA